MNKEICARVAFALPKTRKKCNAHQKENNS